MHAGDETGAPLLGRMIRERRERLVRRWARAQRAELEGEAAPRRTLREELGAQLDELARLLETRGAEAPRPFGEAVRHHGGRRFTQRRSLEDVIRELNALAEVLLDEWLDRAPPGPWRGGARLLVDCVGEALAAASADYARALRSARQRFQEEAALQTILSHLDEGVILVEPDGVVSFATPPVGRLIGIDAARLVGVSAREGLDALLAEVDARDAEGRPLRPEDAVFVRALRDGARVPPELIRIRRGGEEVVLETSATLVLDEETGEVRGAIATFRDRTDLARRSEELSSAYRDLTALHGQLVERSRLQAMGELAAGVALALNNALNAMRLRLRLLTDELGEPSPHLDSLERTVEDVARLVARLQELSLSRAAARPGPVDAAAVSREALDLLRPQLAARANPLHVIADLAPTPPALAAPAELREILLGLLLNARDAMPAGGKVVVRTRAREGGGTTLTVADQGPGLAPERLAELFEPLRTTKPGRAGLGLAMARATARRWGGELAARNAPGGGAELELTLAPAEAASERASPPAAAPAEAPARAVLVIDDDADNRLMLAEVLALYGHRIETAATAAEALDRWRARPFDVALCDLAMPDRSGWELARDLRALRPEAAIALVTGWRPDVEELEGAAVDRLFYKPVDLARLLQFLDRPTAPVAEPSGAGRAPPGPSP